MLPAQTEESTEVAAGAGAGTHEQREVGTRDQGACRPQKKRLCPAMWAWMALSKAWAPFLKITQFLNIHKPKGQCNFNQSCALRTVYSRASFPLLTLPPPNTHRKGTLKSLLYLCLFVAQPDINSVRRTNEKATFHIGPQAQHNSQFLSSDLLQSSEKPIQKAGHSSHKVNTFGLLSVSVTLSLVGAMWYQCMHYILAFTIYSISLFDSLQPSYQFRERKYWL